jgi:coenzyme Q-binding protein COQ10
MFALVADIERYPEFIPWCTGARVLQRQTLPDGREQLTANLDIAFKMFRETYTSRVILDAGARTIEVEAVHGPFRTLNNNWEFIDHGEDGCTIVFEIDFAFSSPILQKLISAVFGKAVQRMVSAFEDRARALYGRR